VEGLVTGDEVDTRNREVGNERRIAGQSVELGDQQGRHVLAARFQALANSGLSDRLPLSTSTYWATMVPPCWRRNATTAAY
jgi:hypothetical protein